MLEVVDRKVNHRFTFLFYLYFMTAFFFKLSLDLSSYRSPLQLYVYTSMTLVHKFYYITTILGIDMLLPSFSHTFVTSFVTL